MGSAPVKETPRQFLERLRNSRVRILLKWDTEYLGTLCSTDGYMNAVLRDATEIGGSGGEEVGDTCIRCNNVKIIEEIL